MKMKKNKPNLRRSKDQIQSKLNVLKKTRYRMTQYFQRTDNREAWHEILIDIVENSEEEKFRYVLSKSPTPSAEIYVSVRV